MQIPPSSTPSTYGSRVATPESDTDNAAVQLQNQALVIERGLEALAFSDRADLGSHIVRFCAGKSSIIDHTGHGQLRHYLGRVEDKAHKTSGLVFVQESELTDQLLAQKNRLTDQLFTFQGVTIAFRRDRYYDWADLELTQLNNQRFKGVDYSVSHGSKFHKNMPRAAPVPYAM